MNQITETLSKIFTAKQIQAMKDAWRYGAWGDCEINFNEEEDGWGLGACTDDIKSGGHFTGRQISGIMAGISRNITKTKTNLVANCHDWWGDGSGDMIFFNMKAFGFEDSTNCCKAFDEWAKAED